MTPADVAGILGGACAVLSLTAGFLVWLGRKIRKALGSVSHFLDDWHGSAPRPGVQRQPGVMERLANMEHELKTNSGSSLKDAVARIEKLARNMAEKFDQHVEESDAAKIEGRKEAQALWRTIEAAVKAEPPKEAD